MKLGKGLHFQSTPLTLINTQERPRSCSNSEGSNRTIIPAAFSHLLGICHSNRSQRDGHTENHCSRTNNHHLPGYPTSPPLLYTFLLYRILIPNFCCKSHTALHKESKSGFFSSSWATEARNTRRQLANMTGRMLGPGTTQLLLLLP